jgi:hypothetical protein
MNTIKVLKNCINHEDAQSIINYIDTNQDSFVFGENNLRLTKMFGDDNFHKDLSKKIITGMEEIEDILKTIINLSIKSISDEFEDTEDIYLSSLWLAKQTPGAQIDGHIDTDGNVNKHYAYSVILYLKTTINSSPLEFPFLNLEIMPTLGDLIIFKSSDFSSFHKVKTINEDRYSVPMWFTKDKNYELKFGEK